MKTRILTLAILLYFGGLFAGINSPSTVYNYKHTVVEQNQQKPEYAKFEIALKLTLEVEGKYVNDPADVGGETYKGIARKKNPKWEGWVIIDSFKTNPNFPGNLEANKNLQKLIPVFYRKNYWNRIKGDRIKSQEIANQLFGTAVNMGVVPAIRIMQNACGAKPTGKMDDATLNALND